MTQKKKPSAFMAPVQITDELAAIVGKGPMPRTEITKKLWEYIKRKKLQDTNDKRTINPDALLTPVLGAKPINMFKMTSAVSKHIKEPALT